MTRRALLLATLCGAGCSAAASSGVNLVLGDLRAELQLTAAQTGWVVSCFGMAMVAALPVAGHVADVWGHARAYAWGFVCYAAGSVGAGCSAGLAALLAGRALQGLGAAMVVVSTPALVVAAADPAQQPRALAWSSFSSHLGIAMGPLLLGPWLAWSGWRGLFAVSAMVGAVLGGLTILAGRGPATSGNACSVARSTGRWGADRRAAAGMAASFGAAAAAAAGLMIVSLTGTWGAGWGYGGIGALWSCYGVGLCLATAGYATRKRGEPRRMAATALAAMALGLWGLAQCWPSARLWPALGWMTVLGLGAGVSTASAARVLVLGAAPDRRGRAAAMLSWIRSLGASCGAMVAAGWVGWQPPSHIGYQGMLPAGEMVRWGLVAAALVAWTGAVLWAIPKPTQRSSCAHAGI